MSEKKPRQPKAKAKYFVRKGGLPCICDGTLAAQFGAKRQILLPSQNPDLFTLFSTRRTADSAINRTVKIANRLKGSMLDGWNKAAPLLTPGEFTIEVWRP